MIPVHLKDKSYPIHFERNLLDHLQDYLPERRYFLLTDSGIPEQWIRLVEDQIHPAQTLIIEQGEASKSFPVLEQVLEQMAQARLSRKDALIALGGGVVGDLGGLAASLYMRGIDFYNIPTSVLAQVDSSVGGKTAIDLGLYKNLVGAFWQPRAVLIDPQVLETLDPRHLRNGLVEALKMGLILDVSLLEEFEKEEPDLEKIIYRSIDLKRQVVEQDEKESDLRRILNFGHTLGHALEAAHELKYLHGECVAAGMLFFLEPSLRQRVEKIYEKLDIPAVELLEPEQIEEYLLRDKKGQSDSCTIVRVDEPGQWKLEEMSWKDLLSHYKEVRNG